MPLSTTLRDETLRLLRNRLARQSLKHISKETGIGETWLSMFGKNKIGDPSVNRIETLYQYLANIKLHIPTDQ